MVGTATAEEGSAKSETAHRAIVETGKYVITIDSSEAPDLCGWVETKLRPVVKEWYPKLVEMLPSEGYEAPEKVTITLDKDAKGVAYAAGDKITCAADWFRKNLDGEAVGAVRRGRPRWVSVSEVLSGSGPSTLCVIVHS